MTEEEVGRTPGAVATQSQEVPVHDEHVPAADDSTEIVFKPLDFRLNLQAKLAEPIELTNLDSPSIRKLTWEQVVPERTDGARHEVDPPAPPLAPPSSTDPTPVSAPAVVAAPVAARPAVAPPVINPPVDVAPPPAATDAAPPAPAAVVPAVEPVVQPVAAAAPAPAASIVPDPVPPSPAEEINRLANVPDLILDDSPIEIPPITPAGSIASPVVANRSVFTPVLPETLFVPSARPPQPNVAAIVAETHAARHRSGRKRVRHVLRSLFSLVIVFGLLGGGAFAAKKYLLKPPQWPVALKPLVTDVENQRGLRFTGTVTVTAIPSDEYVKRLMDAAIGVQADVGPEWRALGLLNGEWDLQAVGTQAMTDAPAFYDSASKTIFVTEDLSPYEHLYRFAMRRALTAALLDQKFTWGTRVAGLPSAGKFALKAVVDADALTVANDLAAADAPDQLGAELVTFVQAHAGAAVQPPYAVDIAGRPGAALRPMAAITDDAALAAIEQSSPTSDAVFDAVRSDASIPGETGTQGLMFWYYVLASRIDDALAWSAASHWAGDSTVSSAGASGSCVDATIAASDAAGAESMIGAFQAWAAAAPAESATTVTPADNNQFVVHACDPGATVASTQPVKVPVAFGGAGVERALVQAAAQAATAATGSTVDAACLVRAARTQGGALVAADAAPVIATNWTPPYVDSHLALGVGCVTAAAPALPPAGASASSVP